MSYSRELQEAARAGREAGRKECLDFLRKEDEDLSRKLEAWLVERGSDGNQLRDMRPISSINDSISPDLLFNIFKRLDCIETTRIRRVCKQWFEIIDEHKSFWRTLHLLEDSLKKWDPSILELLDRKSGSTLQDVDIRVEVERELQNQFFDVLLKSKETIKHLFLKFRAPVGSAGQDLFESLPSIESLRVLTWHATCKVRLRRRRSNKSNGQENKSRPLVVLWYGSDVSVTDVVSLKNNSDRLKNLVSLDSATTLSSSDWRTLLEDPSKNLKHLRIGFENRDEEDHSGIATLKFPNLEVLELDSPGEFPQWLLIPDTVKLIAHSDVWNLPSISELWTFDSEEQEDEIVYRVPKLITLCLLDVGSYKMDLVLRMLNERKGNVEAGLHVDGVKMEMIQTLILSLDSLEDYVLDLDDENLKKCRELVEVVEGDAQSRFIEVDV